MTATMVLYLWWTWPALILCAWWWADRTWRWTWFVSIEAGAIGAQWAYIGIYALAQWPAQLVVVLLGWVAYPLVLAVVCYVARRQSNRSRPYDGY